MGSGKSSLGKELASVLQRPFVDLDQYIEAQEKKSVATIFSLEGEAHFRSLESSALQILCSSETPSIIALGGGSINAPKNLEVVKNAGHLIYLKLSARDLFSRLRTQAAARPLIAGLNDDEMLHKIESLLSVRESSYSRADLILTGRDLDVHQLKQSIIEKGWV
jgi:shikimate kinase